MAKKNVKKIVLLVLNVLVIVGLSASTVLFYLKYQDAKEAALTGDQKLAKYEKEINKTYTLPTDEKAQLYDVNNADQLKKDEANKDFFKDIQNGDVLLIYTNNKLGIIYRPTTKKIIKTGPLAFKQQLTAAIIGAKSDREAVIAVLKRAFSNDITSATEVDAKTPLAAGTTIIVDLTGNNKDLVAKLASELKGKVDNVPEGQDRPADTFGIAIYAAPATVTP
jgi:hypothetical protein